jgi:hypothetical protein
MFSKTTTSSRLQRLHLPAVLAMLAPLACQAQQNGNLRPQTQQNGNLHTQTQRTASSSQNSSHLAMIGSNQSHLVQSQNFIGHPGPPGSTEIHTRNGIVVRRGVDGQIIDVRNPHSGMLIHHGLDGSRHVTVEGADHSRIYATTRGMSYVQHPYVYNNQVYDQRTYAVQGQLAHRLYRPYAYAGQRLDVYATTRYYKPDFYRWAVSRFNPTPFTWTYVQNPPPWYGYYRSYFVPEASYSTPLMWLADYLLASSLQLSYVTEPPPTPTPAAPAPASDASAAITPQVKEMLAREVGRQVHAEAAEAQANTQNQEVPAAAVSIVQELSDHQDHVFVVASDLDLVEQGGRRCMVSEGDVVDVRSAVDSSSGTALAVVLASKGSGECERAAQVPIPVNELQEMQNHMRATIDQGMANTAAGRKAQTSTPAFAAAAPPADANAAREIDAQQKIAAAEG